MAFPCCQPLSSSIHAADLIRWQGDSAAPEFHRLCADIEDRIGVPATEARASAAPSGRVSTVTQLSATQGYVWIPPGEFWMGATPDDTESRPDEKPRHLVRITKGFWMSETPVTVAEFKRFSHTMPQAPSFDPNWSKEDHPIVCVAWAEAKAYCEWAGGRLPTEAEWEYAARDGKDGLTYPCGNDLTPAKANYSGSKWKGTSPVRSYPADAWGLYDMAGNVWEWVADAYAPDYYATLPQGTATCDPLGPQPGKVRVLRGGSFASGSRHLRAACRLWGTPGDWNTGFRCVRQV